MKKVCFTISLLVWATSGFGGGTGGGGNPPAIVENTMRIFSESDFEKFMMSRMALLPVTAEDFELDSESAATSTEKSEQVDTDSK